mgnify:CR=1 FL=1
MGYIAELRKYIGHQPILMPAGCAMIINEKKQLLLQKRADNGCWAYPGGAVELGESFEECAVREVLEETGLSVKRMKFLFSLPNVYEYSGFSVHTADCFFLCEIDDETALFAADDAAEVLWIPVEELRSEEFGLHSVRRGVERLKEEYFKS